MTYINLRGQYENMGFSNEQLDVMFANVGKGVPEAEAPKEVAAIPVNVKEAEAALQKLYDMRERLDTISSNLSYEQANFKSYNNHLSPIEYNSRVLALPKEIAANNRELTKLNNSIAAAIQEVTNQTKNAKVKEKEEEARLAQEQKIIDALRKNYHGSDASFAANLDNLLAAYYAGQSLKAIGDITTPADLQREQLYKLHRSKAGN